MFAVSVLPALPAEEVAAAAAAVKQVSVYVLQQQYQWQQRKALAVQELLA